MAAAPGQDSGHPFDWGAYVAWLVEEHGSLAAVADRLAEARGHVEAGTSIERALRRLRGRGTTDGGRWGQRCLRAFGVPRPVTARVRWMGHYHSRFTDLPVPLCAELLRAWDRPPVSASRARVWLQLGRASVALRQAQYAPAAEHLARVDAARPGGAARAEWALVRAFLDSRAAPERVPPLLDRAEAAIAELDDDDDRACLVARLVDQRGYELNRRRRDPAAAHALYASLPEQGPPFAVVRRHSGLGWSAQALGRSDEALAHARAAVRAAGDGGSLRLRAMALKLLGRILEGPEGEDALRRARAIAERLDDETLRLRLP